MAVAVLLGELEAEVSEPQHGALTLAGLQDTMREFRAKHGRPLKAIRISEETMYQFEQMFPVYPSKDRATTLYAVPIQIDNDLEMWDCEPVYA